MQRKATKLLTSYAFLGPGSTATFCAKEPMNEEDVQSGLISEIGLLIGMNVPKAIKPEEVIKSLYDKPCARRTVFRWTVTLESKHLWSNKSATYATSNSVSRGQAWWAFKYDFPEGSQGEHLELMEEEEELCINQEGEQLALTQETDNDHNNNQ